MSRILQEISAKTGLRIAGSAPDDHVFGTYGPGPLNLVLPALLDGLPVNMLLTDGQLGQASALTLTARAGAPTPSSVPTQQDDDDDDDDGSAPQPATASAPPTPAASPSQGGYHGGRVAPPIVGNTFGDNGISGSDNGINGANNGINGADNGIGVAPSGTDVNATGTASPNGVRTPQQIFEELQRLRQQQQSQPQQ